MAHSRLYAQSVQEFPDGHFQDVGRAEFVFTARHKKKTKIVATRHDFWAQNVLHSYNTKFKDHLNHEHIPKFFQSVRALNPLGEPHSALTGPLAGLWGPLCGTEGRGTVRKEKRREGEEVKIKGRREGEGKKRGNWKKGREKEGRGLAKWS